METDLIVVLITMTIYTGLILWWISKTHSEGRFHKALREVLDILKKHDDSQSGDHTAIDACEKALGKK